jgi:hypothetical protein
MFVLLTYDLREAKGAHTLFIDQMKKKGWTFEADQKHLPNTTCYKSYNGSAGDDTVAETALNAAVADLNAAEQALKTSTGSFVERYVFVPFQGKWKVRLT